MLCLIGDIPMFLIALRVGTKVRTENVAIRVEIAVIILFHMAIGKSL